MCGSSWFLNVKREEGREGKEGTGSLKVKEAIISDTGAYGLTLEEQLGRQKKTAKESIEEKL